MSLVTQMLVAEKYGPLLSVHDLADLLDLNEQTVRNQISSGEFPIPTTRQPSGRRVAHYQDVAAYLDSFKSPASSAAAPAAR